MQSPFSASAAGLLRNDHPIWSVDTFNVTLFRDVDGTVPVMTDLCTFISKSPDKSMQQYPVHDEKRYFPPSVVPSIKTAGSTIERTNVHTYLNEGSCHDHGYELSSDGIDVKSRTYPRYRLICKSHGRSFRQIASRETTGRKRKGEHSTANTTATKCPFQLPIYLDPESNRVFIRKNSGRCFKHEGHAYAPPDKTITSVSRLPRPLFAEAVKLIENNLPPNIVNIVLQAQSGRKLDTRQLSALKQLVLNKKHGKGKGETPGSCLIRILKSLDGCRYSTLSSSVDVATGRVRVYKSRSRNTCDTALEPTAEHTEEDCDDPDIASYVQNVVKALKIGEDEILLAVVWTTKEGYVSHMRFPFILGTDVVFGNNNEKRPHIRTIGKNARNKNLPFADGFLPSQQRYVFYWYLTVALPTVLNPEALKRTQIMITDQCVNMCPALSSALAHTEIYGDALERRCKWHIVSQFFSTEI